jgi:hypothetical protein
MRLRRSVLAAALAGALFAAEAGAAPPCGGTVDYFDWACRYRPGRGWLWELETVGARNCVCGSGCFLSGHTTSCLASNLTESCGGTSCEDNAYETCDLPTPDPATCTGPGVPADREGWARHDGTPGLYAPNPRYSYNSRSYANQINNPATGHFRVWFPGLGGGDGNVQVVAYGAGPNRCQVENWSGMPDLRVDVSCHTPAGVPVNTRFLAYFLATDDTAASTREIAYARYEWPPAPSDPAFQWNSNGPLPVTTRLEAGSYAVRFRNLMHPDGAAAVTAVDGGPRFCQVLSSAIYTAGADTGTEVRVWCFDTTGRLADSGFSLRYEWRRFVAGSPAREGYAYANHSTSGSYTPTSQFNSTGALNAAARLDTGTYELVYPGVPYPDWPPLPGTNYGTSTVLVSARTLGPSYCKVASWTGSTDETTVKVLCFNASGALGDRTYQQVYLTRYPQIVPQP